MNLTDVMKKFSFFFVLLATVLLPTVFSSCSNTDDPNPDPIVDPDNGAYEVKLSLGGEYTEVSESPLSRAEEETYRKFYGINVYCMKTDGTEAAYNKYAYGVFDNTTDIKISLLGGYKYKFECTSVEDDFDEIYYREWYEDPFLEYPFNIVNTYNTIGYFIKDINNFIISQNQNLNQIKRGRTTIKDEKYGGATTSDYPRLNRYYGELEDFVPGNGSSAVIPLKRTVFGINVVVNGVPDGSLTWTESNLGLKFNTTGCTGSEKMEFSHIFTFSNVYNCWKSEEPYTENCNINFTWTRANGYKQYFSENITVKRNVMTTITVNLKGGANDINIGISEEDVPMDKEDVSIDFDGGDLNDTEVEPQS